MKKYIFLFCILLFCICANAQNRNSIWCFGDSAGIDFSDTTNPITFTSQCNTRGSVTSIADTSGNLIFYTAETPWGTHTKKTRVFNFQNQIIQNGDSIVGLGWYHEHIIIDNPNHPNQYYLFSVGVTTDYGLYYSRIDMSLNAGLGVVIQKNIQLLPYEMSDGVQAIKHGNGRDWWILCKRSDLTSNSYIEYLVTPSGISTPIIQSIGDSTYNNGTAMDFSADGKKMSITNAGGLCEICDFDRCSGTFSNLQIIHHEGGVNFYGCEFSPNKNFIYLSSGYTFAYLLQVNLNDSNPWATHDTLWTNSILYSAGNIELAPDGKIYYATAWYDGLHFNYPYPDTAYYPENMNLGVINYPDSLGAACLFQPYSFNLGGSRTYWGLPNNPNYDLPADTTSLCDSLSVTISEASKNEMNIFPNPFYNKLTFRLHISSQKNILIQVFNSIGENVFEKQTTLSEEELNLSSLQNGIYFITIQSEKYYYSQKIVKL